MNKKYVDEEFDWFAVDRSGCVALFATAGEGFVLDTVSAYRVMHDTVAGSIEYPNWGSDLIWADAAKLGFYDYDWTSEDGAYVLAASPTQALDPQMQLMISRITELPRFAGRFSETQQVADPNTFAGPAHDR